jgi:hypothetical protein
MRRLGWVLILCMLLPIAAGAFSVDQPQYQDGDWFEYDGWTAAVFAQQETEFEAGNTDFESLNLVSEVPMRIEWDADESIELGGEIVGCGVSTVVHSLNMSAHFTEGSTEYVNDTMALNITTTIQVWMPRGANAFEKRVITAHLDTWFSGGGEDNHLETRIVTEERIERDGLWPAGIEAGDEWDFAETIARTTTVGERTNGGLWNETSTSETLHRQVTWTASAEVVVSTGEYNDENTKTMRIEQQIVGENQTSIDWYHEEGYLVKTQHFEADTLVLSATLVDHHYEAAAPTQETTTSNSGMPAVSLLATLAILGLAAIRSAGKGRGDSPSDDRR